MPCLELLSFYSAGTKNRVITSEYYGDPDGTIWLDDVNCTGIVTDNLLICSHAPLRQHNCDYEEDVGLFCYRGDLSTTPLPISSTTPPPSGNE